MSAAAPLAPPALGGSTLFLAATLLAFGDLMAMFDTTIANVSIPNLAAGSPSRQVRQLGSSRPTASRKR